MARVKRLLELKYDHRGLFVSVWKSFFQKRAPSPKVTLNTTSGSVTQKRIKQYYKKARQSNIFGVGTKIQMSLLCLKEMEKGGSFT